MAFPQEEYLTDETGREFFAAQTYTAVAEDADTGRVIYFTRTMSDVADIYAMPAMPSNAPRADFT